jgi:rsbT co-antagonist protein RsbR
MDDEQTMKTTLDALQAENSALHHENEQLRQRIQALEPAHPQPPTLHDPRPRQHHDITAPECWQSWDLLQAVIDFIPDPIFVKDRQHRWIACNQAFCQLIGHPYHAIIGYSDPDRWPPEQAQVFWEKDDEVFHGGQPVFNEEFATGADGVTRTIWTRKFPMRHDGQEIIGLCGIITDISDIKERQREIEQREAQLQAAAKAEEIARQQEIIEAQRTALHELSVPLLPLADNVIAMPLIGTVDTTRAQDILETLLEGIARHQADIAILDITGIKTIDTQVAQSLIRYASAGKLLGAQVVLTGIQPHIAQTLVQLGASMHDIVTCNTLQNGIAYALERQNH